MDRTVVKKLGGIQAEGYLRPDTRVAADSLRLLKSSYDVIKSCEKNDGVSHTTVSLCRNKNQSSRKSSKYQLSQSEVPVQSLIVEDFDENQIWEEVELQNIFMYDVLLASVSSLLASKPKPKALNPSSELEDSEDVELNSEGEASDDESNESDNDAPDPDITKSERSRKRRSIVDDKFFSLHDMTEFLEKMEKQDDKTHDSDEDIIDYFKDLDFPEEDEYYYKDFFDPPNKLESCKNSEQHLSDNSVSGSDTGENSDDSALGSEIEKEDPLPLNESKDESQRCEEENLTSFQKRQRKIEDNIKKMEEEALKPKPWQLLGEATADTRPENSLLEEHLVYDSLLRQAPEITVNTTQKLEDIIRQRIRDHAWDDVVRKIKPVQDIAEFKKKVVLDAEKSKLSLTDIYEKELMTSLQKQVGVEDEEPEEHRKIRKDMKTLFAKLDALSHFNFTPIRPAPTIKTIDNISAMEKEEVGLTFHSSAMQLAPQEIKEPSRAEVKSKAERSETDKNRERRKKKKLQHLKRLRREEKAREKGLGVKNVTISMKQQKLKKDETPVYQKELTSSKAFFSKLQDQVTTTPNKRKVTTGTSNSVSAKKYKL